MNSMYEGTLKRYDTILHLDMEIQTNAAHFPFRLICTVTLACPASPPKSSGPIFENPLRNTSIKTTFKQVCKITCEYCCSRIFLDCIQI